MLKNNNRLDDNARRVLRMLFDLYRAEANRLDVDRLMRLSGKSKDMIMPAIEQLLEKRYIIWDRESGVMQVLMVDVPVYRCLKNAGVIAV